MDDGLQDLYTPVLLCDLRFVLDVLVFQGGDQFSLCRDGLFQKGCPADCDCRRDGAGQRDDVDEVNRLHYSPSYATTRQTMMM